MRDGLETGAIHLFIYISNGCKSGKTLYLSIRRFLYEISYSEEENYLLGHLYGLRSAFCMSRSPREHGVDWMKKKKKKRKVQCCINKEQYHGEWKSSANP